MKEVKIVKETVTDVWVDGKGRIRVTKEIVTEPYEVEMEIKQDEDTQADHVVEDKGRAEA
jgi:hypothetical protein